MNNSLFRQGLANVVAGFLRRKGDRVAANDAERDRNSLVVGVLRTGKAGAEGAVAPLHLPLQLGVAMVIDATAEEFRHRLL